MLHTYAAICRLGHVVSRDIERDPAPRRCPRCGVVVFDRCIGCNRRIPGPDYELRQGFEVGRLVRLWDADEYTPPAVCTHCRVAHPWRRMVRRRPRRLQPPGDGPRSISA